MKSRIGFTLAIGVLLATPAAFAQEEDPTSFAAYFHCDESREARADTLVMEQLGPIFDRYVEAGHLNAWGWLSHNVGGHWRRVWYFTSPSRDVAIDARSQIIQEIGEEAADAGSELNDICPTHDDYIWTSVGGSGDVGAERAAVAISTYYECDFASEARADEIVGQVFAPIFNQHVEAGTISGWSWLAHDVGGKYRRLGVFDAVDHNAVLNGRDAVIEDVMAQAPEAVEEFSQICYSHSDYVWDITIARP